MCERVKGGNNLLYCNYLICSDDILIQISKGFWGNTISAYGEYTKIIKTTADI